MTRQRLRSVIAGLVLGVLAALLQPSGSCALQAASVEPLRVLFIGNSYIYVNDLPAVLAELVRASHELRPIETKTIAVPAATLQAHWEKGEALNALRQARWDFVVLQEQSVLPTVDPERMARYARLFDAEIKRSGAQTILFLTWARAGKREMQQALDSAYTSLARELGSLLAPVGPAWQRILTESPRLRLYQQDGSHPTPLGTYVAACVFYAVIYGKAPEPSARRGDAPSSSDATLARKAAWDAVQARN